MKLFIPDDLIVLANEKLAIFILIKFKTKEDLRKASKDILFLECKIYFMTKGSAMMIHLPLFIKTQEGLSRFKVLLKELIENEGMKILHISKQEIRENPDEMRILLKRIRNFPAEVLNNESLTVENLSKENLLLAVLKQ